jgi:Spy/CpxP family protein refolding chaperone
MKAKSIVILLLGLFIFSSVVFPAVQEQENELQGRIRLRTRENIITLMLLRMTRFLELTEDQTAKVYPLVTRVEKEKMTINQQIARQMQELRMMLKEGKPDPEALKLRIQALKELRDDLRSKDAEAEAQLEEILTVVQQAKYLVFMNVFFKELRENLERARNIKGKAAPKKK